MSYETNVYYHPEKHGLTQVAMLDFSSGHYEFDYTVAWVDENKNLYWADDSGCSCPSPFENYTSKNDLRSGSVAAFRRHLIEREKESYGDYVSLAEVTNTIQRVKEVVGK